MQQNFLIELGAFLTGVREDIELLAGSCSGLPEVITERITDRIQSVIEMEANVDEMILDCSFKRWSMSNPL